MKSSRCLLKLFLAFFLFIFMYSVFAEDEYGTCYYPNPKKNNGSSSDHWMDIRYVATPVPAVGTRSAVSVGITSMDDPGGVADIIERNDTMDGTRIENAVTNLNGDLVGYQIKISWQSNANPPVPASLTLPYKVGKKLEDIDGILEVAGIKQDVLCVVRPSQTSLHELRLIVTHGPRLIVTDIADYCSVDTKKLLIGLGVAVSAIAYYCK